MFKRLILCAIVVLSLGACKKDDPASSSPTPAANYYFKCKIDGIDWAASIPVGEDTLFFGMPSYVIRNNVSGASNQFLLGVTSVNSTLWSVEGTYVNPAFDTYDMLLTSYPIQLSVSHDSSNRIISGTFAFHLADSFDSTLVVNVTNGEFRVKY